MITKSLIAAEIAEPPPQVPRITVTVGITPLANTCLAYTLPNASSASVDSSSLMPAQSVIATTGTPTLVARSYTLTICLACISPIVPPRASLSWL